MKHESALRPLVAAPEPLSEAGVELAPQPEPPPEAHAKPAPQPEPPVAAPGLDRYIRPLAIYSASRVFTLLAFAAAARVLAVFSENLGDRPWPIVESNGNVMLRVLTAWDGSWYLTLAEGGYPHMKVRGFAFFPGYPLLVRGLARFTGMGYIAAGLVIVLVCGAVTALLVWEISRQLGGSAFADRSVMLFAFLPGSFVFTMTYSEPLMLAAAAGCLLALLHRRWVTAGSLAALATFTRPNAIVLVACCGWAAFVAIRERSDWRALAAPALSVVGIGSYFLFLWGRLGSPFAWLDVQSTLWDERVAPQRTLGRIGVTARQIVLGQTLDLRAAGVAAGVLFCIVAFLCLARWRPPAVLTIYAVGVVVMALTAATLGPRPRFVATAFPLTQAVAWRFRGTPYIVVVAVAATLLALIAMVSVMTTLIVP